MVVTERMIQGDHDRREWNKRLHKLMICRASYSSGVPNGVEFAECQDESLKPCSSCPVMQAWEQVRQEYAKQKGITPSEANWLTHQFFDVPTACLCNGKLKEAEKIYFPARYEEALKRQRELLGEKVEEKKKETPKTDEKQMSIFDYLGT